jgi:AcrR family transcriptional regulator
MDVQATTRDAILDAAERLFARQGFAATTIKHIAAEADVNSALLYYYFDDKETLYRETLRRLFSGFIGEVRRRLALGASPAERIRRLVETQVEFMAAHPHMPTLLVREMVDHQAAQAEEHITQLAATVFEQLCELIKQGQRDGIFRRELDPRFAAVSTIAQVAYLFIARPAIGLLLGYGTQGPPPDTVRAFGRHAAEFAIAALATRTARPGRAQRGAKAGHSSGAQHVPNTRRTRKP